VKDSVKKTLLAVLAAALGALAVNLEGLGLPAELVTVAGAVLTAVLSVLKPPGTPTPESVDDAYHEGYSDAETDYFGPDAEDVEIE
jgi:hypothetical protein